MAWVIAAVSVPLVASPSQAVAETCDGLAATVVGAPGTEVVGTAGNDVIVSNGSYRVVDGSGDDIVCTSVSKAEVELGGGRDTFLGGPDKDRVRDLDGQSDLISTGGGDDSVAIGCQVCAPATDEIDLGEGQDEFSFGGTFSPALRVTGASGMDTLGLLVDGAGSWLLDVAAGQLVKDGIVALSFRDFEAFQLVTSSGTPPKVTVRGSAAAERVSFGSLRLIESVHLGAGDDVIEMSGPGPLAGGVFDGGPGQDTVVAHGLPRGDVVLDLTSHEIVVDGGSQQLRGFESASASGGHVEITGTEGPNVLQWWGCGGGAVRGLGGDDTIQFLHYRYATCPRAVRLQAFGGEGSDVLIGGGGRDHLDGGAGRDSARGGQALDTCIDIERRQSCERPRP
jgi:Ca2+-binding RTX toxin-like protein